MAESKVSPAKRQALIVLQNGTGEKLTGAEKWAFFCGFDAGRADAIEECAPALKIAEEIKRIMEVYREQEASSYGVDTPGGLEHMGDVWKLLHRWDAELRSLSRKQEEPR